MADLTSPFDNAVYPDTQNLGGDGITNRGSDPNAAGNPGSGSVQSHWPGGEQLMGSPSGEESANSVSGLPSLPNRFEPSETPAPPPSLEDRRPGTIDER